MLSRGVARAVSTGVGGVGGRRIGAVRWLAKATRRIKRRVGVSYFPDEAVRLVKSLSVARFDETVEAAVQLSVDPRKPGQAVRGVVELPHGSGRRVVVAAFVRGEGAQAEARAAGADVVGLEELVAQVERGEIEFTTAVAAPDVMPVLGKVARILGPRGLMPNAKVGTLTKDIPAAVRAAKRGRVEFRVERMGIVHAPIGKASFSEQQLLENLRALLLAIHDAKPETLSGNLFRYASLAPTMGKGVPLDPATIDPTKARFMASIFKQRQATLAAKAAAEKM